ncbi:MAG: carboxylating nicotinate-nucleotide diphosphorylase [Chitinispirillia bacterium]|jgi:nicotinate-nucleotide pyrophosphorylase (carboxylating)
MMKENDIIQLIINRALEEDLNEIGDITSQAIFGKKVRRKAVIKCKEKGVLSGVYLIEPIFKKIDKDINIYIKKSDSDIIDDSMEICIIEGPVKGILAGERTVLNFLQRLSGIATHTAYLVSLIKHTRAKLLDTRKTTPTLRILEKKAVLAGGGHNHRFGLYDMILIKDTHIRGVGTPSFAVQCAKKYCQTKGNIKIEIEVQSIDELKEVAPEFPDRIMLDNMNVTDIKRSVEYVKENYSSIELEASGNITSDTIIGIAQTGVDYISSGAITHSSSALDLHLVLV